MADTAEIQLAQVLQNTAQDHQYFREVAADVKFIFAGDQVSIAARRNRGYVTTPYTQWTSDDLIGIYSNNQTRPLFNALHNMFRAARGGQGDPVAIGELRGLAPTRCNRDFQCFRSIFNEAIDRINSQRQHGSIELPLETMDRSVAALVDRGITFADSSLGDAQPNFPRINLAAKNLSTVRAA